MGRLSAEKGHLGLLDAFSDAIGRGINAELILVGDGPEKEKIDQAITNSTCQRRFEELGFAMNVLHSKKLPDLIYLFLLALWKDCLSF